MYPGVHARDHPDRAAVVQAETGEVLTYGQLEQNSVRLAHVLHEAGLRRGDHVAFLSENSPVVFEIYWAALRSGLYVTGINHHLSSEEIAYIVEDCGATALIVSAGTGELARELGASMDRVGLRLSFGGPVEGYASYERALAGASARPLPDQPRGTDMLYSSGTTGRPKGIKPALPERQVGDPGDPYVGLFGPMYGFDTDTVYFSAAPTYHAAPLRFAGVIHALGGTVVMARRFDAESALAAIEKYRVTHSQWVPTMFVRMLKLPAEVREHYDASSMEVAIHAAAPCPVEVKRAMIAWWGPVLFEYYSSTEGNGITFIDSADWLAHPGSVGRPGLGTIHICAADGGEQATGSPGTVYFERDVVPFEYHNDAAKTRDGQHPEHETWSTTGDVGYVDQDGYLFLTDRQAFMIISGGVNIYPQEVENCLTMHPSVLDVAVIGIPDDEMGEQVKAVVEPAPGATPGPALEAELLEFVRARIAHYKTPRTIDFTESLPRSAAGKLQKHLLTQRYAAPPVSA